MQTLFYSNYLIILWQDGCGLLFVIGLRSLASFVDRILQHQPANGADSCQIGSVWQVAQAADAPAPAPESADAPGVSVPIESAAHWQGDSWRSCPILGKSQTNRAMLTGTHSADIRAARGSHNAADITILRAMGFKFAIWRHNGVAWVDVIPHRGCSHNVGINGQYCPMALNNKLSQILG